MYLQRLPPVVEVIETAVTVRVFDEPVCKGTSFGVVVIGVVLQTTFVVVRVMSVRVFTRLDGPLLHNVH